MSETDQAENRRPLKTRQWPFFHSVAAWLAQVGVSPNAISCSSVFFACGAGVALAGTNWIESETIQRLLWVVAAACIQLRLIANLLDGMVAIEGGKSSLVGELYNEVPDRISDTAIFVGAGFAIGGIHYLGFMAAVVALFVAYVRAMGASVRVGQVFLGPMAKPHRMALMTTACLYCGILPISWQPTLFDSWGVVAMALLVIVLGGSVTAIRRLLQIASLMKTK